MIEPKTVRGFPNITRANSEKIGKLDQEGIGLSLQGQEDSMESMRRKQDRSKPPSIPLNQNEETKDFHNDMPTEGVKDEEQKKSAEFKLPFKIYRP